MKPAKRPPVNLPTIGDRVRLRGRGVIGILRRVIQENNWSYVDWEAAAAGPVICHLFELEKLESETQDEVRNMPIRLTHTGTSR